jgi:3,4-dihydroxy 2-butanone 4-phosphate synthase/GTP cyclohydrolase II
MSAVRSPVPPPIPSKNTSHRPGLDRSDRPTLQVERLTTARIPTVHGEFSLCLYANDLDHKDHLALVMGEVQGQESVLVRIHSECFTGDVLGSLRCDCRAQMEQALHTIAQEQRGVLIYLRQEGRGIGLRDKLRAYNLQDQGYDTVEANWLLGHQADERDYTLAAAILNELGPRSIRLLTNNPEKLQALRELGIAVVDRVPLETEVTVENADYLRAKASRLHHLLATGRDGRPA